MFAFVKHSKIEAQLKKLYNADLALAEGLNADHLQPDKDHSGLGIQRIKLEREKIALAFDELKIQLPNWSTLKSGQLWKLNKPGYAYGTIFIADSIKGHRIDRRPSTSTVLLSHPSINALTQLEVKTFLSKAITRKVTEELKATAYFTIDASLQSPIEALGLYNMVTEHKANGKSYTVFSQLSTMFAADAKLVSEASRCDIVVGKVS